MNCSSGCIVNGVMEKIPYPHPVTPPEWPAKGPNDSPVDMPLDGIPSPSEIPSIDPILRAPSPP
jgi:hypothetical protein